LNNSYHFTGEYFIFAPHLEKDTMKKDIHPDNYRLVVFKDLSVGKGFITRSCAQTKETTTWEDGKEYPLVKLEISNESHPFYTGKMKFVDTAGRIDKFNKKFAKFAKAPKKEEAEAAPEANEETPDSES